MNIYSSLFFHLIMLKLWINYHLYALPKVRLSLYNAANAHFQGHYCRRLTQVREGRREPGLLGSWPTWFNLGSSLNSPGLAYKVHITEWNSTSDDYTIYIISKLESLYQTSIKVGERLSNLPTNKRHLTIFLTVFRKVFLAIAVLQVTF